MKYININFFHKENTINLSSLINEINQFCKLKSLTAFGFIDTFSKGNVSITSNVMQINEDINSEIKHIFLKYDISKIDFSIVDGPEIFKLPPKIILYNDNI